MRKKSERIAGVQRRTNNIKKYCIFGEDNHLNVCMHARTYMFLDTFLPLSFS